MTALHLDEARSVVLTQVQPATPPIEIIPLDAADTRILAAGLDADRDCPPFDRSVRDGYAIRAADLPGPLGIIGESKAGGHFEGTLGPGQAVEIMTGAPVPPGADSVIMIEHTRRDGNTVTGLEPVAPGEAISPRGLECRAGDVILPARTRLDYAGIAALAMAGRAEVRVFARPRVAIIATGDELVEVALQPGPHQIRNSNAWSLAAQVRRAGGAPVVLGIARDEYAHTREMIERGLESELLLLSGGVSAGKYDIVESVLAGLGAEFFFTRVKVQPGQPLVFGKVRGRFFFGLPGNPASTMVTFAVIARAALDRLAGLEESPLPLFRVALDREFRQKRGLTRVLPATLSADGSRVHPISSKGSADIPSVARANAFLVSDPERDHYGEGEPIRIFPK